MNEAPEKRAAASHPKWIQLATELPGERSPAELRIYWRDSPRNRNRRPLVSSGTKLILTTLSTANSAVSCVLFPCVADSWTLC